ncbi:MAG TPA: flippase [Candidatus Saccharimonadales bacterium]|nr:flippase [Candidatus Saccharimonadales bacterium]
MDTNRRIALSSAVQITGKFLAYAVSTVLLIVLSTHLGTSGIGQYTTITTFVSFFVTIADFGLSAVLVREIAQNPDRKETLTAQFMGLRVAYSLLILALAPLASSLIPQYRGLITEGVVIAALAQFILLVNQIFVSVLQTRLRLDKATYADITNRLVTLVFTVVAASFFHTVGGFLIAALWATTIGSLVNTGLCYAWAKKHWRIRLSLAYQEWPAVFLVILPLGIFNTIGQIYFKVDTIILSLLKSSHDVGIYGYAYNIFAVIFTIPTLFIGVVLPKFSQLWKEDREGLVVFAQKVFSVVSLIIFPLTAIIFVLAPFLTVILARQSPADGIIAGRVLIILCASLIPYAFQDFFQAILFVSNSQVGLIKNLVVASIVNLGLNFLLIPRYGYMAAATVTLISEIIMLYLTVRLSKRVIQLRLRFNNYGAILTATVAAAVLLKVGMVLTGLGIDHFASLPLWRQVVTAGSLGLIGVLIYVGILLLPGKRSPLRELVESIQSR